MGPGTRVQSRRRSHSKYAWCCPGISPSCPEGIICTRSRAQGHSGRASHVHAHETIVLCIGKQGNVLHLQGRGHEGQQSLWSTRRNSSTQLVQSGQLLAMHIIPFLQKKRAVPAALFAPPLVNAILLVLWCWHSVQPSSTSPCSATWPHPALGCRCWSPAGEQPAGEKYRRWLSAGLTQGAAASGVARATKNGVVCHTSGSLLIRSRCCA